MSPRVFWQYFPERLTPAPAPPVSPKCRNKAHFQPETLSPHHRRAYQSSLAPHAGANYIQGGNVDVSCMHCIASHHLTWRRHLHVSLT